MSQLNLTPIRQQHVDIMRLIAASFSDTPMVLKGGTALLLAHGLDRYSEDLDFDSTHKINPKAKIKAAFRTTKINMTDLKVRKHTDTVSRWMVYYKGPIGEGSVKLEVSHRSTIIDPDSHTLIDGIQVYKLPALIDQKLAAIRGRSKVRDLYDIGFLVRESPECFSDEACRQLVEMVSDVAGLVSRYAADHAYDTILAGEDLEELVLELEQSTEELNESKGRVQQICKR